MKLHEMKQKRNTIATDMRALHDKIGDNAWTDEQRAEWNNAKSELDGLDERINREEELRRQDQKYISDREPEQRNNQNTEGAQDEKRAYVFDKWMRSGAGELSSEERQVLKELRAQGVSPAKKEDIPYLARFSASR